MTGWWKWFAVFRHPVHKAFLGINRQFSKRGLGSLRQWGFVLAMTTIITIMITPSLNLAPVRYTEGDIITETIILNDNITLVDQRSTALRKAQAIKEFSPVYDYESRLLESVLDRVKTAFAAMRQVLSQRRKQSEEYLEKVRKNSLDQVKALHEIQAGRKRSEVLQAEIEWLVEQLGEVESGALLNDVQKNDKKKWLVDLQTLNTMRRVSRQAASLLSKRLIDLKAEGRQLLKQKTQTDSNPSKTETQMHERFNALLGDTVSEEYFRILHQGQFSQLIEEKIIALLTPLNIWHISSAQALKQMPKVLQLRDLKDGKTQRWERLDKVLSLEGAKEKLRELGAQIVLSGSEKGQQEVLAGFAQNLLRPNLVENKTVTRQLQQKAVGALAPVYFKLLKGEVVAKAGQAATAQQVEIIRALRAYNLQHPKYPQILGAFLLVLGVILLCHWIIFQRIKAAEQEFSQQVLMGLLVLLPVLVGEGMLLLIPGLTTVYEFISPLAYHYLIPVVLTSMLASLMFRFEVAIFLGLAASLFVGVMVGNSWPHFVMSLMGCLVASLPPKNQVSRVALLRQGIRVAGVNGVVWLVLHLVTQQEFNASAMYIFGASILNGLLAALLCTLLLPVIEKLFDITTDFRLLELGNLNHPALKELAVRAPGTYHHSIVVGNLSEAAAEGIEANPLLVRVASYYHDLGKMLCPVYFVENQHRHNYHEDLPARTSAHIILNHVTDGIALARKFKLGRVVTNIIAQHHGDSLVRYFYHRAQEELAGQEDVDKNLFRYRGPRPQTKEAGLVMVADVTEAATRSLREFSAETIRQRVRQLIQRVYAEEQLDSSGMTLNDLNYIEKTFIKMLISVHHHRIEYPGQIIMNAPVQVNVTDMTQHHAASPTQDKAKTINPAPPITGTDKTPLIIEKEGSPHQEDEAHLELAQITEKTVN